MLEIVEDLKNDFNTPFKRYKIILNKQNFGLIIQYFEQYNFYYCHFISSNPNIGIDIKYYNKILYFMLLNTKIGKNIVTKSYFDSFRISINNERKYILYDDTITSYICKKNMLYFPSYTPSEYGIARMIVMRNLLITQKWI